jgi:hypothetical protein
VSSGGDVGIESGGDPQAPLAPESHIVQVVDWTAEAVEVLAGRVAELERRIGDAPAKLEQVADSMRLAMIEQGSTIRKLTEAVARLSGEVHQPPQTALAGLEQQLGDAVSSALSTGLASIREALDASVVQAVHEISLSIQLLLVRLQSELATAADEGRRFDADRAITARQDMVALQRRFDELRELLLG